MKHDEKSVRERKTIIREERLGNHISISELLQKIGDAKNKKGAGLRVTRTGYGYESYEMILVTKSLETDEELAERLAEIDERAEARRKREEAARKKELAELARLKDKYESNETKEEKTDEQNNTKS